MSGQLHYALERGRLLRRQGRIVEARIMLAEIYNWFTFSVCHRHGGPSGSVQFTGLSVAADGVAGGNAPACGIMFPDTSVS